MQPNSTNPNQLPQQSAEQASGQPERSSEQLPPPEQTPLDPTRQQPATSAGQATPQLSTIPTASPAPPAPTSSSTPESLPTAAEADLPEKVWVDKAEKIIETDKEDPQREEVDQQALSRDYVKQRFNIDINKEG